MPAVSTLPKPRHFSMTMGNPRVRLSRLAGTVLFSAVAASSAGWSHGQTAPPPVSLEQLVTTAQTIFYGKVIEPIKEVAGPKPGLQGFPTRVMNFHVIEGLKGEAKERE